MEALPVNLLLHLISVLRLVVPHTGKHRVLRDCAFFTVEYLAFLIPVYHQRSMA